MFSTLPLSFCDLVNFCDVRSPVFDFQAANSLEFLFIVGHKYPVFAQGMGRN